MIGVLQNDEVKEILETGIKDKANDCIVCGKKPIPLDCLDYDYTGEKIGIGCEDQHHISVVDCKYNLKKLTVSGDSKSFSESVEKAIGDWNGKNRGKYENQ